MSALDKPSVSNHFLGVVDAKLTSLRKSLEGFGSVMVAYSGGVDSVFLAFMAHPLSASTPANS